MELAIFFSTKFDEMDKIPMCGPCELWGQSKNVLSGSDTWVTETCSENMQVWEMEVLTKFKH